jgi:hypothetical protein
MGIVILREIGPGLFDREVPVPDDRGVVKSKVEEEGVIALGRRWILWFCVGFGVALTGDSSMPFSSGELPKSPEAGSKTLSKAGSGALTVGERRGESERSNMRFALTLPPSKLFRSRSFSGTSGSNEKSSLKTSTMIR